MVSSTEIPKAILNTKMVDGFNGTPKYPIIPAVNNNGNKFGTKEITIILNLNSPLETPSVNAGNGLLFSATAVGATDETPDDNMGNLFQTVVNSFDPNDKTCIEGTLWLVET